MWKGALFQLSSTDDPKENLETINEMINTAAAKNVDFIALPETANCISNCKTHQDKVLQVEEEDITLASLTKAAKNKALNILVGSLALKLNKSGHKLINRSFFIDSSGKILAKYDKLHMFDACVSDQKNIMKARDLRQGKKRKSFQLPSENLG